MTSIIAQPALDVRTNRRAFMAGLGASASAFALLGGAPALAAGAPAVSLAPEPDWMAMLHGM